MMTDTLDNCEDPSLLWAEIHKLRSLVGGPDGYETWRDAAVAERVARVNIKNDLEEVLGSLEDLANMASSFPTELHVKHPDVQKALTLINKLRV